MEPKGDMTDVTCNICKKAFKTAKGLGVHRGRMHPNAPPSPEKVAKAIEDALAQPRLCDTGPKLRDNVRAMQEGTYGLVLYRTVNRKIFVYLRNYKGVITDQFCDYVRAMVDPHVAEAVKETPETPDFDTFDYHVVINFTDDPEAEDALAGDEDPLAADVGPPVLA